MRFFFYLFFSLMCAIASQGAIVQINGKWSDDKYAPTMSVPEHFDLGARLVKEEKWEEALDNFLVIAIHFPESPFYSDSLFYSGVCYYFCEDFDLANTQFSKYLDQGTSLQHFEKVFEFKYHIAEKYTQGARRHLFGIDALPKWMPGKNSALEIYDEIISTLPSKELGCLALYGKGKLLFAKRNYREAIDTLVTLTRRFPKTESARDSFVLISEIYLAECILEPQNPDFLALAKVNLQRFVKACPQDAMIAVVEKNVQEMKEVCARTLVSVAEFYQKKKKPKASRVYYEEVVARFPDTEAGRLGATRLELFAPKNEGR